MSFDDGRHCFSLLTSSVFCNFVSDKCINKVFFLVSHHSAPHVQPNPEHRQHISSHNLSSSPFTPLFFAPSINYCIPSIQRFFISRLIFLHHVLPFASNNFSRLFLLPIPLRAHFLFTDCSGTYSAPRPEKMYISVVISNDFP